MTIAQMCDVMALLRKAPRTKRELVYVTGYSERTIDSHIKALEDEGHIRRHGVRFNPRGPASPVYWWLVEVHGEPPQPAASTAADTPNATASL